MKSFREKVAYLDGSYFLLIYEGTPFNLTEDEYHESERRLRVFMDNKEIHSDMIKNIAFIRTIFIDYNEEYLYVKYHDKTKDEYAEYKKGELTLYDCKDLGNNPKKKNNKNSYKSRTDIYNQLKNIGPIGIGEEEYRIIDTYNLFYNMNPNFAYKDINVIIQCMVLILKKYGITIVDDNDYILDEELGIPISPSLNERIGKLFPYGIIRSTGKDTSMSEEEKENIKNIGKEINQNCSAMNRIQELIKVTKSLCDDELHNEGKKLTKKKD